MLRRIALVGASGAGGAIALAAVQIRAGSLFGAGPELDAFFVGAAVPAVLLSVGAGSIIALVVPRLPTEDTLRAARSTGRLATLALLYALPLSALLVVAAPLIVALVGPGLDATTAERAASVLRIYAASVPATAAVFVLNAHAHAVSRGWAGGASTAVYGLVWFGLLFVDPFESSARSVATAGLLATGAQLGSAWWFSSPRGHHPTPWVGSLGVARAAVVALAAILGATVLSRAGLLLDPLYGSLLDPGSISLLSYATRIELLAVFVCGQGAALSVLAVARERGRRSDADASLGLVAPLLLASAVAVVMVVAGPAGAELLLARGEFSAEDAARIGHLLQLYAPAVIVMSVIWALEAILYAGAQTTPVLRRAAVGFGVNAAASGGLVAALGIWGRPLGLLVGVLAQLALLLRSAAGDTRVAALWSRSTIRYVAAVLAGTAVLSTLGYLSGSALTSPQLGAVLASALGAATAVTGLLRFERGLATADPAESASGTDRGYED